ncbi:acetyltransferase [Westerdykella ornata]|uniref:Acetyltransferase n=1 Tax=Westerdykella ornata TaxID=318751 RepID=A0A6A6JZH1_WESOR|nr:acetyltransferase [Westerdykella ornata]KAF2281248.1 acetyltransferase [Westerdykella ornata]
MSHEKPALTIRQAHFPKDLPIVTALLSAHISSPGIDRSYHNYEQELSNLPGRYAESNGGALLLASQESNPDIIIGCACLRAFAPPDKGEVRRFYVLPESRRLGAGRKLLEGIVEKARKHGYKELYLDTLETMTAARELYSSFGFEEVGNYYGSPLMGTVFYRLRLD